MCSSDLSITQQQVNENMNVITNPATELGSDVAVPGELDVVEGNNVMVDMTIEELLALAEGNTDPSTDVALPEVPDEVMNTMTDEVDTANEVDEEEVVPEVSVPEEVADEGDYDIYVVQEGDTLADISFKLYGEARRSVEIARLNKLENTNQIFVGQQLKVPN